MINLRFMKKLFVSILGIATVSMFLFACGAGGGSDSKTAKRDPNDHRPTVGVLLKSANNDFGKMIINGAKKYATEHKKDLRVVIKSLESEKDVQKQIDLIHDLISEQVDMMVISPADSIALVGPIKRAMDAGIKVVVFDVRLDEETLKNAGIHHYTFVGPDNRLGAREVANHLAKSLDHRIRVAILEGIPDAYNSKERVAGFTDVINKYGLVLVDTQSAHWESAEASMITLKILEKHPDLAAIMAANDEMAVGAYEAVKRMNLLDKIKIIGFDNTPKVRKIMQESNAIVATEDFFGADLIGHAIDEAWDVYQQKPVRPWRKTPVKLVTLEDVRKGK